MSMYYMLMEIFFCESADGLMNFFLLFDCYKAS